MIEFRIDALPNRSSGSAANFGQRGVAPIAYALFALALGTLTGAMLRRTLPAMAATLLGFFVVRYSFQLFARRDILAPITVSVPNNLIGQRDGLSSATSGGWILSSRTVDAAGHTLPNDRIDDILADTCGLTRDSSRAPGSGAQTDSASTTSSPCTPPTSSGRCRGGKRQAFSPSPPFSPPSASGGFVTGRHDETTFGARARQLCVGDTGLDCRLAQVCDPAPTAGGYAARRWWRSAPGGSRRRRAYADYSNADYEIYLNDAC
jgi:hypothetical protein